MKYKVIIPIIFIIIVTMFTNIVLADDENIDIVNIPGQTSVPVTAISSDNVDIVNIEGQKSEPVTAIPSDNIDIVNIPGQTSVPVYEPPLEDNKTNSEDIKNQKNVETKEMTSSKSNKNTNVTNSTNNKKESNIEQEKIEETKENITNDNTIIEDNKENTVVQTIDEEKRNSRIEYEQKNEHNIIWIIAGAVAFIVILGIIVYIKKNNKK